MKDEPEVMKEFVKIVQRFPEVYDYTLDSYRMRTSPHNNIWVQVMNCVKNELNEDCNTDELKLKWKGVRSSYNRYINKLNSGLPCKKYYLYDLLRFLDPFVNNKTGSLTESFAEDETSTECTEFEEEDIKPEVVHCSFEANTETNIIKTDDTFSSSKRKRKTSSSREDEMNISDENGDLMQFFQSIVTDLKHFTPREKRKFKMGILGLIDVIEDQRGQGGTSNEVTSS